MRLDRKHKECLPQCPLLSDVLSRVRYAFVLHHGWHDRNPSLHLYLHEWCESDPLARRHKVLFLILSDRVGPKKLAK